MLPYVLTHPQWDPVALRLGPFAVHWYALMYLLGFALGYVLLVRRLRHQPYARITDPAPWTRADVEDLILNAIMGVIVGGRLGYCLFYKPQYYAAHPLEIFAVWQGGMSFHGGAIGVAVALLVYAWRRRRPFLEVTDLLVPAAPAGLAAGRLGNFINGELWGRQAPDSLPWAMIFPLAGDEPRHPSQLYQLTGEGLLLALLLWAYARRERARGQVSGAFVFGYGAFRFAAEYFREPDVHLGLLGGLSMGQWLCLPMILGGALLWLWARRKDQHAAAASDAPGEDTPVPVAAPRGRKPKLAPMPDQPGSARDDDSVAEKPTGAADPTDGTDAGGIDGYGAATSETAGRVPEAPKPSGANDDEA